MGSWWLNLERAHQADNIMVLWVSDELSWVAYIGQATCEEGVSDLPYQTEGTLEISQGHPVSRDSFHSPGP